MRNLFPILPSDTDDFHRGARETDCVRICPHCGKIWEIHLNWVLYSCTSERLQTKFTASLSSHAGLKSERMTACFTFISGFQQLYRDILFQFPPSFMVFILLFKNVNCNRKALLSLDFEVLTPKCDEIR